MSAKKKQPPPSQSAMVAAELEPRELTLSNLGTLAKADLQYRLDSMAESRQSLEVQRAETQRVLTILEGQIRLYDSMIQSATARAKEIRGG